MRGGQLGVRLGCAWGALGVRSGCGETDIHKHLLMFRAALPPGVRSECARSALGAFRGILNPPKPQHFRHVWGGTGGLSVTEPAPARRKRARTQGGTGGFARQHPIEGASQTFAPNIRGWGKPPLTQGTPRVPLILTSGAYPQRGRGRPEVSTRGTGGVTWGGGLPPSATKEAPGVHRECHSG